MTIVLFSCLIIGTVWLLLTAFLGDLIGGGADDVGVGGHDVDVGGHDAGIGHFETDASGHDFHADTSMGDAVHLGPFSPMILACFLATFGASGLIFAKMMPAVLLDFLVVIPAAVFGAGVSGGLMYGFNKLSSKVDASSEAEVARFAGLTAEVITPIPEKGIGQVSFVVKGTRLNSSAKSVDESAIPRGSKVIIDEVKGSVLYVSLHPDERMSNLGE